MPVYFAVLTIVLMLGMVVTRAFLLKRQGVAAMQFGKIDKTDFLIPPFALFYFYLVFATAFHWPKRKRAGILSLRGRYLGRRAFLPGRAGAALLDPGFIWMQLSGGHRSRAPRQAHHDWQLCLQSQSHLCCFCLHPGGPIPGLSQLDPVDLPRRRRMAIPSPGIARRGLLDTALWTGIRCLLSPGKAVPLRKGGLS